MPEATISLLDDAELDFHEKRAAEMAARLNTSVEQALEAIRSMRAEWRACCDLVAAGRPEDAHAKRSGFEKEVLLLLAQVRHVAAQAERAANLLPQEIRGTDELHALLAWLERFHNTVLRGWLGPEALEELAGEYYPLSSAELDAIGARHPAPVAWYEEDSKPF
jgi:hypothetical protein